MIDRAMLDALLREATRAGGLAPRADWGEQALQFLADVAARRGGTAEGVLQDRAQWPKLIPGLLGCLTVGETHFFRHPGHFDRLVEALAARLSAGALATASVLSAGCASGEEPYSVAIAVHRRLGAHTLARVRILAADISAPSIAKARAARYGAWTFRDAPEWLKPSYFSHDGGSEWQLMDVIRRAVVFEVANLVELAARLPSGALDAVLFRNVAIYLAPEVVEAAYREFHRVLAPGGLLIVAPADPRPRAEHFADDGHESTSVYLRRPEAEQEIPAEPPSRRRGRGRGRSEGRARAPAAQAPAARAPAAQTAGAWAPAAGASRAAAWAPAEPVEAGDAEARAMRLGDRGDLEGALAAATSFVERHPTAATGYWARARIAMGAGNAEAAVDDLRRMLFLRPEHRLARYWYVLALWAAGRVRQAIEQARVLEGLLEASGGALLEDDDTTARQLLDAVRFIKEGLT
ncbi:MAG: methyltransferase domain-containing protein [Polyangiaceae bacterium]|nr:methyltransferase domain-containing protein [Polyangiaceae bacterium]